jgi:glycosyltransferase involved in cell wall biosynthesis
LLQKSGIDVVRIQQNDESFNQFIIQLNPNFVIFDRFLTEEQFGWRVEECCPDAVRIVDSVDLHFLRRARQEALETGASLVALKNCEFELSTETAWRELASFLRSDGTLVLSDFERDLLVEKFHFDRNLLFLSRFHYPPAPSSPNYAERSGFAMIGNFRHPPNADGVLWFRREIWPKIRERLPDAQVQIYGAYPPKEMSQLTDRVLGFHVLGPIVDQYEALRKCRVNLAPLRFGAGIKGKITDGWWAGAPVVTTSVGAEGMSDGLSWGGEIADDSIEFAEKALKLYENEEFWESQKIRGTVLLQDLYSEDVNSSRLLDYFVQLRDHLETMRRRNYFGSILKFHQYRSTKYFSKWIEEKNKFKCDG